MAEQITVFLTNEDTKTFKEQGRAGGSYTIRAEFTEGWVVIVDEYEHRTAFPSHTVKRVEVREHPPRW